MKKVLITGASRGIGGATAKRFLDEGYFVIGTATDGKTNIKHANFISLSLDLTSKVNISEITEKIAADHQIYVLVNCAGVLLDDNKTTLNVEELRDTLEVNLIGLVDFTEGILPYIEKGGRIINISSKMGSLVDPAGSGAPAYQISKAALNKYTQTLASRLERKDIKVASMHPGWVRTRMGGEGGTREPEVAAQYIFKLATSDFETGQFYEDGKKREW